MINKLLIPFLMIFLLLSCNKNETEYLNDIDIENNISRDIIEIDESFIQEEFDKELEKMFIDIFE